MDSQVEYNVSGVLETLRPEWAGKHEPFIRLSHSTLETVNACERKFQIEKLLQGQPEREESVHFSFGHAYGTFVAMYLLTEMFEYALYEGWLAYYPIIETDKKSQATYVELALQSKPVLDQLLEEWEVATFNGQPAIELDLRIDIDEYFFYVGYVDVVLRHKTKGLYAILDAKTTGLTVQDLSPLYKHSGQALGYSIVLDEIAPEHSSNEVIYLVGRLGRNVYESTKCEVYPFYKGLADRLRWFTTLLQDVERIKRAVELANFPRRVGNCLAYNKPCRFFGTCHLTSQDMYKEFKQDDKDKEGYTFHYHINELIDSAVLRLEK